MSKFWIELNWNWLKKLSAVRSSSGYVSRKGFPSPHQTNTPYGRRITVEIGVGGKWGYVEGVIGKRGEFGEFGAFGYGGEWCSGWMKKRVMKWRWGAYLEGCDGPLWRRLDHVQFLSAYVKLHFDTVRVSGEESVERSSDRSRLTTGSQLRGFAVATRTFHDKERWWRGIGSGAPKRLHTAHAQPRLLDSYFYSIHTIS